MRGFVTSKVHRSTHHGEDMTWIRELWPGLKASDINEEHYAEFLRFADAQIEIFNSFCPEPSPIQNLFDALRLVSVFQNEANLTRQRAAELAASMVATDGSVDSDQNTDLIWRCVELAARLWATLNIHIPSDASCMPASRNTPAVFPGQLSYVWVDDSTLQAFVLGSLENRRQCSEQLFPLSQGTKLEPKCTMAYLFQAYDFRPHWTSNLADHLKIDTDSRTITIYEHKICLWNHILSARNRGQWNSPHGETDPPPILSQSVLIEAIDTLNLLFPFGDEATEAFLKRERKVTSFYGLGSCTRDRQLDTERYRFWRKEIEEIASILSQPPRGKAQFLLDRDGTNSRDVWTFWTAIAFGVLAVIGVATGVYSAVYARKAFDVGVLQYQLALAQACSAENATDDLPGFCR
ncbi:hypothetical protein N8I77_005622 [Diaporthe amygdali]|uniref:Uncharacterized protein n=1 Tax=Phomopsis amygdali TaxID=1214568 RepID=A0AAD9SGA8_PHOAM|nr:hypothetical protein N8I77_005622 [Diaporthe amygdali]